MRRMPHQRPLNRGWLLRAAAAALVWSSATAGSTFAVTLCPASQTVFDSASLSCSSCGSTSRVPSNRSLDVFGNAQQCSCANGLVQTAVACDPSSFAGCGVDTCSGCTAGSAPSTTNATLCLPCGASTAGVDASTGDCTCGALAAAGTHALVERSATGVVQSSKECVACPARSRVFSNAVPAARIAADPYRCVGCSDPVATMTASGECACDAGYRTAGVVGVFPWAAVSCLPAASAAAVLNAYPESAAIAVSYYSVQLASAKSATSSLLGKTSKAFQHLYASAAVGCLNRKPGTRDDACQALANLCVLQLYSPTATVCALYTAVYNARKAAVNGFQGWPGGGLPFLTYSASEARAVASDPALTRPMSFDEAKEAGTSDTLQLFVARYSLNGTFLGIARLRNQLEGFCAAAAAAAVPTASSGAAEWSSSRVTTPWLGFGYGYSTVFACDLNLLAASPLATDPVFYDLYVRDLAADAAQVAAAARAAAGGSSAASSSASGGAAAGLPLTLYPVPVAITNYVAADGSTPNVNKASASEADDVYARRFTLVEAVSGITAAGAASEVLRYASSLRLTVRALRDGNNRPTLLSPPVLTITYRERLTAEVAAAASDASPNSMAVDATAFAVEYTSENADYGRTVLALAVSLGMLVLGWAFVRVAGWIRMNARTPFEAAIGLVHVAKLGEHLLTSFAPAYFWFLWAICLYWLVFFKLQTAVYILLPVDRPGYVDNEYVPFTAALTTVFICYLMRVLLAIYYQGACCLTLRHPTRVEHDSFGLSASFPAGASSFVSFARQSANRLAPSHRSPLLPPVPAGSPSACSACGPVLRRLGEAARCAGAHRGRPRGSPRQAGGARDARR